MKMNRTEKENIMHRMVLFMKEIGKMIYKMELEKKLQLIKVFMKENLKMEKEMEREN